jgi:hypothetical protein
MVCENEIDFYWVSKITTQIAFKFCFTYFAQILKYLFV